MNRAITGTAGFIGLLAAAATITGPTASSAGQSEARPETAPLVVAEPAGVPCEDWPLTSGVPFARGRVHKPDGLQLIETSTGEQLPLQTRVTCRWPDGSIKWILMDTRLSLKAKETKGLKLVCGSGAAGGPALQGMDIREDAEFIRIDTGPLQATIGRKTPGAIGTMLMDLDGDGACGPDERMTSPWLLVLDTTDGHVYRSDLLPAEVELEERGPLRSAVRIDGPLADGDKTPRFRYLVRLHFYAGQSFVRAFVTLIVDVPDQLMVDIRSFKLILPTATTDQPEISFGGQASGTGEIHGPMRVDQGARLFQTDDQKYTIAGQEVGRRAEGWADRYGQRGGVAVGIRHFWQQWPKALAADAEGLAVELIPAFEDGLYDQYSPAEESRWTYALRHGRTRLKMGVAKTHEIIVYGHQGQTSAANTATFFRKVFEPLLATCEPTYICATKALGDFPPADPENPDRFMGYDRVIGQAFEDHLVYREKDREYGLLNFGDWWGERGYNWGNLEYDMQRGLIAQYARTGRRDYYLRAEDAARHHIDVDVVHAVNSQLKHRYGRPPAVGDVWVHATGHTGGYFDEEAFKLEWPYTLGFSLNLGHVWDRGDLDYYFLSGNERAREVGLQIAERLRISAAPYFKIGTHMRDIGWPMIAMMAAYRATGETKYLDAVRHGWEVLKQNEDPQGGWMVKLAKGHCLHEPTQCKGNVDFIMAIVISALCDYHRETGDPEVARSIVRAVDFTLRETYVSEKKMFRYTSCPLTTVSPARIMIMSESLAYAWRLSGDEKYRRVLCEATDEYQRSLTRSGMGKGFSMNLVFSPESLWGLDRNPGR